MKYLCIKQLYKRYELLKYGKNNKKEQDKEKIKMNANDETLGTVRERERESYTLVK